MVECGGLENRFTGIPGDEGSNPSSSARNSKVLATAGTFFFWFASQGIRIDEVESR